MNAAGSAELTLVTGATGRIGSELCRLLCAAGQPVRAFVRTPARAAALAAVGAELAVGDFGDPDAVAAAMRGVRRVFMVTPDTPRQAQVESDLIDAAERAGVARLVKVSAFAAGLVPPLGYGIGHAAIEDRLRHATLAWAVLRPYVFMQNFLDLAAVIVNRGIIPLPLGAARVSFVDARDVARVGQVLLREDAPSGRVFEVSGPMAMTVADVAAALTGALGTGVCYKAVPGWLAGLTMLAGGVSRWHVRRRLALLRMLRAGGEAAVRDTVPRLTGTPARVFSEFVYDHRKAFLRATGA